MLENAYDNLQSEDVYFIFPILDTLMGDFGSCKINCTIISICHEDPEIYMVDM